MGAEHLGVKGTTLLLRTATIADIPILEKWDNDEDAASWGGDDDVYDWAYELPRKVEWREFLIAEVGSVPIGMVVIIDALQEETHYWGEDAPTNSWAIDIWIGEPSFRSKGYGRKMMEQAFELCFVKHGASSIVIDPLQTNKRAIEFCRRLGFKEIGLRRFGDDDCLVMAVSRAEFATFE